MPGVPAEMVEMMESTVAAGARRARGPAALRLATRSDAPGIGESRVAEILHDLFDGLDEPEPWPTSRPPAR